MKATLGEGGTTVHRGKGYVQFFHPAEESRFVDAQLFRCCQAVERIVFERYVDRLDIESIVGRLYIGTGTRCLFVGVKVFG